MDSNEILFIAGRHALVIGEWIPFGSNYIDLFSRKIRPTYSPVGSTFLAEEVDTRPENPVFEIEAPPTELAIRETVRGKRVVFSAKLSYADTGGDEQQEWIGVNLDVFGRVFYGASFKEVDRHNARYSLDSLAPVVADLVNDSSRMMSTLLTSAQNRLLDLIHRETADERDKFVALMAERLVFADGSPLAGDATPLDDRDQRAEISQLMGEIHSARRLADGALLIHGRSGLLLFHPQWEKYERAVTTNGYIHSLQDVVDNLFSGAAMNHDRIRSIKHRILTGEVKEAKLVRKEMTRLSDDIATYPVICNLLDNAVASIAQALFDSGRNFAPHELELFDALDQKDELELLKHKVDDLHSTFAALEQSLHGLVNLVNTLQEEETERLNNVMQILTVVTTVAVPITIITGWFGMNFQHMPELAWPGSYPILIGSVVLLVAGLLILFKRKKWF